MYYKPKPTYFRNQRYKSRLEARWAFFLWSARIPSTYEPLGESTTPDFAMLQSKRLLYMEVKGGQPTEHYVEELINLKLPNVYIGIGGFYDNKPPLLFQLPEKTFVPFFNLFPSREEYLAFCRTCQHRFDLRG